MVRRRNRVSDAEPLIPDDDEEVGKYGRPKKYDPQFRGPIQNRSCTDIICCFLFVACLGALGFVASLAWMSGDPTSLLHPTDYRGQVCGRDQEVKDKPLLFYFDYMACAQLTTLLEFSCNTPQICVTDCPNYSYFPYTVVAIPAPMPGLIEIKWTQLICDYGFDPQEEYETGSYQGIDGLDQMFRDEKCASYYLPQTEYGQRCVPTFLVKAASVVGNVMLENTSMANTSIITPAGNFGNATTLEAALSGILEIFMEVQNILEVTYKDIVSSWPVIIVGLFIGMLLAMLYIMLMRWVAGIIVWFTIIALNAVVAAGTGYSFYYWKYLESIQGSDRPFELTTNVLSLLRTRTTWLILGCVLGTITAILFVITLCLCNRIRIAVALIKEASRAVGSMMSTLFWPIIPFFLEVFVVGLWMVIAVYLATSHSATYSLVYHNATGFPIMNGTECMEEDVNNTIHNGTSRCQFSKYAVPDYTIYLQFYNLFMLFWLVNFVIALGQMTLAGAFASYYWAFTKPQDIPDCPVYQSLKRSLRYHLGSLAFGSLIIAIIQVIRVILEYIEQKLKGKANNDVVKYIIKCLKCFFWLLEKVMKIINKNAFIVIAIYGKSFCPAAREAFFLLMRNIVRVAVVNKLTDFIILLGKLTVSLLVGVGSFCFFTERIPFVNDHISVPAVTYHWTPIAIITIGTYAIAWCFFSVYDMAVDTLFLCFLEDLERHDGSAEKPYFMSKALKNIVGKKNVEDNR
ncbi:Choline transporter-like protein 2 [Holothuria leucospilota]|uniref:Choline transporter-like protein n=1 Tax=Holothuria leucospilota TaxID=206669 RepID=A0A9Q1C6T5_HOLLE|nr:Choline transporter-like protein 2 [Holothuria leucospilota]